MRHYAPDCEVRYLRWEGHQRKKSAIQLSVETPLQESLRDIPRMDEITYKYLGFEMEKEVMTKEIIDKLEQRIKDKLAEPTKMVEVFEARIGFNTSTKK